MLFVSHFAAFSISGACLFMVPDARSFIFGTDAHTNMHADIYADKSPGLGVPPECILQSYNMSFCLSNFLSSLQACSFIFGIGEDGDIHADTFP